MKSFFSSGKSIGRWRIQDDKPTDNLLEFLLPREKSCTAFTSRLRNRRIAGLDGIRKHKIIVERSGSRVISAVLDASDGIFFPVFSDESSTEGLGEMISQTGAVKKRFVTLMGAARDVETVSCFFNKKSRISIDYHQLAIKSAEVSPNVRSYLKNKRTQADSVFCIRSAVLKDLDRLMPLRRAYEIEEVLLDPDNFSESSCRMRFGKTIRDLKVLFAEIDGIPAGTCCINADGFNWHQIGGVYTIPAYRSQGLSSLLMEQISFYSMEMKKNLTLFVKKTNKPALKLYENCGFKNCGEYRISYIERI